MKHSFLFIFLLVFSMIKAQQTDVVDFEKLEVFVYFDTDSSKVFGTGKYIFKILKPVDSIFIDAVNMKFYDINADHINQNIDQRYDGNKLWLLSDFKAGQTYEFYFDYTCIPKKAMYFVQRMGEPQIWTQGQGKYTSNWLPSIDDMNEKIEFDLGIGFDARYEIISNGKLISKEDVQDTTSKLYQFDMQKPMSSYLVALAIGKYNKKVAYSKSGIPLEMYYYPEDSLKFEPTYRYTKRMFDFLENEIGYPYPWQNYKQIPVHDFLYAGMENTGTTIFSDAFVVDSIGFNDRNYVNVNAHELAHQWFGDLVTETSGTHHWLQEGFATYYALRAERDVFGPDYYDWRLYESAQQLWEQDKAGSGTSLLDPKSSSLTFYQRGAWVLHALRIKVGGKALREAVQAYLQKHQFANVETDDFLREVELTSGQNLKAFKQQWIVSDTFPYEAAMELLKTRSTFIQEYLMADCEVLSSKCDEFLNSGISDEAKSKVISQVPDKITSETFKSPLKVRQAIAGALERIPLHLKSDYETLLNDKSYITQEIALFNLWNNFPDDRARYLNATKSYVGFADKNLRTLWLTLAIITSDDSVGDSDAFFEELTSYTSSAYSFEVRQNAFKYLKWIRSCNEDCQKNLKDASTHHNWRFRQMAKQLLNRN